MTPFDTNPPVPFDCIQSNKTDMNQTNRLDSRRQPPQSIIKSIIKSNIIREIYVPQGNDTSEMNLMPNF